MCLSKFHCQSKKLIYLRVEYTEWYLFFLVKLSSGVKRIVNANVILILSLPGSNLSVRF